MGGVEATKCCTGRSELPPEVIAQNNILAKEKASAKKQQEQDEYEEYLRQKRQAAQKQQEKAKEDDVSSIDEELEHAERATSQLALNGATSNGALEINQSFVNPKIALNGSVSAGASYAQAGQPALSSGDVNAMLTDVAPDFKSSAVLLPATGYMWIVKGAVPKGNEEMSQFFASATVEWSGELKQLKGATDVVYSEDGTAVGIMTVDENMCMFDLDTKTLHSSGLEDEDGSGINAGIGDQKELFNKMGFEAFSKHEYEEFEHAVIKFFNVVTPEFSDERAQKTLETSKVFSNKELDDAGNDERKRGQILEKKKAEFIAKLGRLFGRKEKCSEAIEALKKVADAQTIRALQRLE